MERDVVRIRSELDVLALVPYTMGFHPTQSLVLVALDGGGATFQARVDLPTDPAEVAAAVESLTEPARTHRSRQALVVAYSHEDRSTRTAVRELRRSLGRSGIDVVLAIRADGSRWFPLWPGPSARRPRHGVPYDVSTHALSSQRVLEGKVTYRDRDDLASSVARFPGADVDEVIRAHSALGSLDRVDDAALKEEAAWVEAQISAFLKRGDVPGPVTVARLLRAVDHPDVRDLAWCGMSQHEAAGRADFWGEVVRRSPDALVASAAALLGLTAWVSGHGALAWCALERSFAADPGHTLARLVADLLLGAVPPWTWQPMGRQATRLSGG